MRQDTPLASYKSAFGKKEEIQPRVKFWVEILIGSWLTPTTHNLHLQIVLTATYLRTFQDSRSFFKISSYILTIWKVLKISVRGRFDDMSQLIEQFIFPGLKPLHISLFANTIVTWDKCNCAIGQIQLQKNERAVVSKKVTVWSIYANTIVTWDKYSCAIWQIPLQCVLSWFEAFMSVSLLAGIPTLSYFPPHRIELLHHCNALEWLIPSDCFPLSFISTIDNDPASPTLTLILCFLTF